MNVEKKKAVIGMLRFFAGILPHYAPDFHNEGIASFWFEQLDKYSEDQITKALTELSAKSRTFPSLGEVSDRITGTGGDLKARAGFIASSIAASLEPGGERVCPIGEEVVRRFGGWKKIGDSDLADIKFFRREWAEIALTLLQNPELIRPPQDAIAGPASSIVANLIAGRAPDAAGSPPTPVEIERAGSPRKASTEQIRYTSIDHGHINGKSITSVNGKELFHNSVVVISKARAEELYESKEWKQRVTGGPIPVMNLRTGDITDPRTGAVIGNITDYASKK